MYVYVCPLSTTPLGAIQMTGRVRNLRIMEIDVCVSRSVRLAPPWPPAYTTAEIADYLQWVDASLSPTEVPMAEALVRLDDDAPPQRIMLPAVEVYLYAERDKLNAARRFVPGFRTLAEDAGHRVIITGDDGAVAATRGDGAAGDGVGVAFGVADIANGVPVAERARKLLAAPDLNELQKDDVYSRIMATEASDDDKWAHYRVVYKSVWGLATVDERFVTDNGFDPHNPCTVQLMHVLYPDTYANDGAVVGDYHIDKKVVILRAPLIRETLRALGFAHPFDTQHVITDIMKVWDSTGGPLKDTDMFRPDKYAMNMRLFNPQSKSNDGEEWSRVNVVRIVNTVLRRIGISLEGKDSNRVTKEGGSRPRTYAYRLNIEEVAKAAELLFLRMPFCTEGDSLLPRAIKHVASGAYKHLART
jgi:hypothetical protein